VEFTNSGGCPFSKLAGEVITQILSHLAGPEYLQGISSLATSVNAPSYNKPVSVVDRDTMLGDMTVERQPGCGMGDRQAEAATLRIRITASLALQTLYAAQSHRLVNREQVVQGMEVACVEGHITSPPCHMALVPLTQTQK
jgi:hypothetical protein